MVKNLVLIKKANNNYALIDGEIELMELVGLKVDSQVLYDKIYLTDDLEEIEFKVNVTTKLSDKEDDIILKQLISLFKSIEESIKVQFDNEKKSDNMA